MNLSDNPDSLTLGVLRRFSGPFQSGFLALFSPGITGKQPVLAQDGLELFVGLHQSVFPNYPI